MPSSRPRRSACALRITQADFLSDAEFKKRFLSQKGAEPEPKRMRIDGGSTSSGSSEVKRGRGRPRKNVTSSKATSSESSSGVRRGRGRPRKNLTSSGLTSSTLTSSGTDSAGSPPSMTSSEVRRGRGRPRKSLTSSRSSTSSEVTSSESPTSSRPRRSLRFRISQADFLSDVDFQKRFPVAVTSSESRRPTSSNSTPKPTSSESRIPQKPVYKCARMMCAPPNTIPVTSSESSETSEDVQLRNVKLEPEEAPEDTTTTSRTSGALGANRQVKKEEPE